MRRRFAGRLGARPSGRHRDVASIVGLAPALTLAQAEREQVGHRLRELSGRLLHELPARAPDCRVTGHLLERLPSHASFAFGGVEIAPVLIGLDRHAIWASSGSACTSSSSEPSHVLVAMGLPRSHLFGALRLTLGLANGPEDVDRLLDVIPRLVAGARRAVA